MLERFDQVAVMAKGCRFIWPIFGETGASSRRDGLIGRLPVDNLVLEIDLIRMVFQEIHAEHAVEWRLIACQC